MKFILFLNDPYAVPASISNVLKSTRPVTEMFRIHDQLREHADKWVDKNGMARIEIDTDTGAARVMGIEEPQ